MKYDWDKLRNLSFAKEWNHLMFCMMQFWTSISTYFKPVCKGRIKSLRWMALIRFHDTFWNSLTLKLLNQWNMASFIGDFLFSQRAKCNREVGSQIENLRVVIVITDQRFILLDTTNRSAKMHRNRKPRRYLSIKDYSTSLTCYRAKRVQLTWFLH